jgi:hypothetical protein
MHLRRRLVVPLAVPIALVMVLGFPLTSQASVGVGVQAGPVRLTGLAYRGGSYALPAVYVVNTGTQAESVHVRVQRLSRGAGRAVPPSWIHVSGPAVRLSAHQAARIPLELVVPDGARPGGYLSDVVVAGSASISVGRANLGAAAATKLEFRVGKGQVAQGLLPPVPGWSAWAIGVLLLLAAVVLGVRRSGLRIRVERRAAGSGGIGSGAVDGQGGHHVA